jgi:hypothetical protein
MAESTQHLRLVRSIVSYIEQEFAMLDWLAIYDDTAEPFRREKPPRIGGYVPDVFAADTPRSTTIIGEAKTLYDLGTQRSRSQIRGFLDYLAPLQSGVFILATPLLAAGKARSVVAAAHRGASITTRVVFLDGISNLHRRQQG